MKNRDAVHDIIGNILSKSDPIPDKITDLKKKYGNKSEEYLLDFSLVYIAQLLKKYVYTTLQDVDSIDHAYMNFAVHNPLKSLALFLFGFAGLLDNSDAKKNNQSIAAIGNVTALPLLMMNQNLADADIISIIKDTNKKSKHSLDEIMRSVIVVINLLTMASQSKNEDETAQELQELVH